MTNFSKAFSKELNHFVITGIISEMRNGRVVVAIGDINVEMKLKKTDFDLFGCTGIFEGEILEGGLLNCQRCEIFNPNGELIYEV